MKGGETIELENNRKSLHCFDDISAYVLRLLRLACLHSQLVLDRYTVIVGLILIPIVPMLCIAIMLYLPFPLNTIATIITIAFFGLTSPMRDQR